MSQNKTAPARQEQGQEVVIVQQAHERKRQNQANQAFALSR